MIKMKFNCSNIYKSAILYEKYAKEFQDLRDRMIALSNEIAIAWQGDDSKTYLYKYNNYIEYLKTINIFLENKALLLKKASNIHNTIDNEMCEQFKRSKFDEEY